MNICILIPAYNEEMNIQHTIEKVKKFVTSNKIVIVDDGSTDDTTDKVQKEGVHLLKHAKNMGKGMSHRTGFDFAIKKGFDVVITMDADGQHAPEEIPDFLKSLSRYDIIIGTREYNIRNMPIIRYWTNRTTSLVTSLLSRTIIRDSQSGYRLIKTEILRKVHLKTKHFQTETEILIQAGRMGYRIGEIPIRTIYSIKRRSYINPVIDTLRFIGLALSYLWA